MWIEIIKFLLFIKFAFSFDLPRKCIADLKINNDRYNVSETYNVGDGEVYPTGAHYDVYGNLFYVESKRNEQGYHYNIKVIKFKTTVPEKVAGLPEGLSYSIAIDKKQTKVYFGTGKGVFVYDYATHSANSAFNKTLQVEMIFIDKNSNKYLVENVNGVEEISILEGDKKFPVHSLEALNEIAVNDNNDFYFIKQNQLFVLKPGHTEPTCIGDIEYDGMAQISFNNNNIFVASSNLKYFHENDSGNLRVVDDIPGKVTAIAFDNKGDFVLGLKGKIVKFKKNECYLRNRVVDEYSIN